MWLKLTHNITKVEFLVNSETLSRIEKINKMDETGYIYYYIHFYDKKDLLICSKKFSRETLRDQLFDEYFYMLKLNNKEVE